MAMYSLLLSLAQKPARSPGCVCLPCVCLDKVSLPGPSLPPQRLPHYPPPPPLTHTLSFPFTLFLIPTSLPPSLTIFYLSLAAELK